MGAFSRQLIDVGSGIYSRAAAEQSGVFAGLNPATFNTNDPFVLWVIQSIVIICMTQFLSAFLSRIRQPRVISEIIGGVILGPSIMGRIPNFSSRIFPTASLPFLSLTSTIGLVFYLFLVGLELDIHVLKRNAKASSLISVFGLAIPLGLGAAIAVPLYHEFIEPTINRGYFILFTAVAVGITAFPVLCRILTELKLLDTTVGILALSAGVGNDVVGWILLALAVALVNATSGLNALYVLLTGIGFVIFLLVPVKWAYLWCARRFGGLDRGEPNALMMTITLIMVLFCAFFTDIIGIHAIFGGFLAGLVIPKINGFEISMVEKLEDFISFLFLPQYFALSGLRTNLGLLNDGVTWGYVVLLCVVSFFAKFLSCSLSAKAYGFNVRESGAVGALMACKGLVELIVLNVGLQAGILNTRVFSMFVLHALVLTFITTPLVLAFYPENIRTSLSATEVGAGDSEQRRRDATKGDDNQEFKTRFSMILDRMEDLPAAMTFTQLLKSASSSSISVTTEKAGSTTKDATEISTTHSGPTRNGVTTTSIDALRLIELSERTSAVLKGQSADLLLRQDPVLNVMRTFAQLNQFQVSTSLAVVPADEFSNNISVHARNSGSQMVVVPWVLHPLDNSSRDTNAPVVDNPFDAFFRIGSNTNVSSAATSQLIRRFFASSPVDVTLFVDRGNTLSNNGSPHLFMPFFGGPDDRLTLSLVVQMCRNPHVTATIVRIRKIDSEQPGSTEKETNELAYGNTLAFPDTVYATQTPQNRLQSDTADNIAWNKYTRDDVEHTTELSSALGRIDFREESSSLPLHRLIEVVGQLAEHGSQSTTPLFIVVGRSRRMAVDSHKQELLRLAQDRKVTISSELPKTFGEVGAAFVATSTNASLMVVQAAVTSTV